MKKQNEKNSQLHANKLSNEDLGSVAGGAGNREEFIKAWTDGNGRFKEEMIGSYMKELDLSRDDAIKQLEADYQEGLKWYK